MLQYTYTLFLIIYIVRLKNSQEKIGILDKKYMLILVSFY